MVPTRHETANPPLAAGVAGRGALITGAGGMIGGAVARALNQAGARLVLTDQDLERMKSNVHGIDGAAGTTLIACDLRDGQDRSRLLSQATDFLDRIDILIHAAAVIVRRDDVAKVTDQDWDLQQEVNLKAAFFLSRDVAEQMRRDGKGGRIVMLTSQAWWSGGLAGSVSYAATKGGIVSITRGLARSYASHGILINSVAPGSVDTPMLRDGNSSETLEELRKTIPLGRFADPEEIAGPILFLVSSHADYITGATLNVSGGQLTY